MTNLQIDALAEQIKAKIAKMLESGGVYDQELISQGIFCDTTEVENDKFIFIIHLSFTNKTLLGEIMYKFNLNYMGRNYGKAEKLGRKIAKTLENRLFPSAEARKRH